MRRLFLIRNLPDGLRKDLGQCCRWDVTGNASAMRRTFDYMLGKCRVLCNPRGYPINRITGEYENPQFDPQLIIDVE